MKAVIDACVLYPTVLREIVMGVAGAGLIAPLWSDRLLEEWARAAERHGGAVDGAIARGEAARLAAAFPDACVPSDPAIEAGLWLPDTGDIHVLATAISGKADSIITLNLKDFPRRELSAHDIAAIHPDAVLHDVWLADSDAIERVVGRVHATAQALSGDAMPLRPLLKRARLPRLAKAIAR